MECSQHSGIWLFQHQDQKASLFLYCHLQFFQDPRLLLLFLRVGLNHPGGISYESFPIFNFSTILLKSTGDQIWQDMSK